MSKIIFYPNDCSDIKKLKNTSERITIQFRKYDKDGDYTYEETGIANETIF